MKLLIIETSRISTSTTIAHVRNSIELTQQLKQRGVDVTLTDIHQDAFPEEQFDIILFSYACGFADFTKVEQFLDTQNAKIGWMTNEFELFANDFIKKRMTFMITNFDAAAIKKAHRHDQLLVTNLNTLIARPRNTLTEKPYDTVYYGTYRKYRVKYFEQYCQKEMILSTSKKNIKEFIDAGVSCYTTPPLDWTPEFETLNLFKSSLYIEDTKTHQWFNHMANRFYEGLYCNTPCFFDVNCRNTIRKDVYGIHPYFLVRNIDELLQKSRELDMRLVEEYLSENTNKALEEKEDCINNIIEFLDELC